jgi:hypothetical protein
MEFEKEQKLWKELLSKHEDIFVKRIVEKIKAEKHLTDDSGKEGEKTFYLNDLPTDTFTLDACNANTEIFAKIAGKYFSNKFSKIKILGLTGELEELDNLNGMKSFEGKPFTRFSLLVKYKGIDKNE